MLNVPNQHSGGEGIAYDRLAACRLSQKIGNLWNIQSPGYRSAKSEQAAILGVHAHLTKDTSEQRRPTSPLGRMKMTANKLSLAATLTTALACAVALTPLAPTTPAMGQTNPTMTNVVPDGGEFGAQGKIQALDPGALTLTLAPESGPPIPMTVAPGVDLTSVSVGDVADVHFKRSVTFVVGSPRVPVGQVPITSSVEQIAQTPGGIGYNAAVVVGRVVKLDGPSSFDVVNANGGGIYTIKTADPTRQIAIGLLKVGDSITVSVSPLVVTSIAKCGLFGKGLFGC
jgi:hypothetical protein